MKTRRHPREEASSAKREGRRKEGGERGCPNRALCARRPSWGEKGASGSKRLDEIQRKNLGEREEARGEEKTLLCAPESLLTARKRKSSTAVLGRRRKGYQYYPLGEEGGTRRGKKESPWGREKNTACRGNDKKKEQYLPY